jgi:chemotaxis family two-component system sensor histidine kinase/response regulator PixL
MRRILIIEDDPSIALALCVRLKAQGYATWIADDAIAGLKLAKRYRPDLILLDITLPAGDGFHLAEQFNRLPETRETPIIITTASTDPELREKALEMGAVGLLRKPFDPEELVPVVEDVFGWWKGSNLPSFEPHPKMASSGAKKILIVEDDHKLAAGLALRMEAAGFEAMVALDALAGVSSAVQVPPDLVLLDISLPAGDGFSVAERIQRQISAPIPIIFLTASLRPDFREKAEQLGAVAFFQKPYEACELLAAVRQALG